MPIDRLLPTGVKRSRLANHAAAVVTQASDLAARLRLTRSARAYTRQWHDVQETPSEPHPATRLEAFFDARTEGRGIFKWHHYFELYDRHLSKFVGQTSTLLEIGIAGGGSFDMWKEYLGPGCDRHGVDIDPACKKFEDVTVFIGDQADRAFWARFRSETPTFDIIIDDGGHAPHQQLVTLEELLPRLRPGGVYICEDIHGDRNWFLGYVYGLSCGLFAHDELFVESQERRMSSRATPFQAAIHSVHLYPFVTVIERRQSPLLEFVASKRGSEWPQ